MLMKKSFYISLSMFLFVFIFQLSAQNATDKKMSAKSKFNYLKTWEKIRHFNKAEKPKSALKLFYIVLAHAEDEKNALEITRSILAIEKLNFDFQRHSVSMNIRFLQDKIKTMPQPAKSIIEEELAEKY